MAEKKKRPWLWISVAVAVLAIGGFIVYQRISEKIAKSSQKSSGLVITVGASVLQTSQIDEILHFQGLVEGDPQVKAYASTAGKLQRTLVREGDFVEKDQVLAELDRSVPGADFLPVPVKAPGRGVVTRLYIIDNGTFVGPDRPFAEIANPDHIKVFVNVGQDDLTRLKTGQRAELTNPAVEHSAVVGAVASVQPFIDRESLTASILIKAVNPALGLKIGQSVRLNILTGSHAGFQVPTEAVVLGLGRASVFVYSSDQVREVPVVMGESQGGLVEISGALLAGQQIVTKGSFKLYDGAKAQLEKATP